MGNTSSPTGSARRTASIVSTGMYVPSRVLTNAELEKMVDTSDEWIMSRTGIRERRIAAEDEFTSDMGAKAAQQALELGKDKIRVNCICPGVISTPLVHGGVPGGKEVLDPILAKAQALGRAGQAEDIANMAMFLASDEASWVTGAAMVVDGGFTAGTPFSLAGVEQQLAAGFSGPSFER